MIVKQGSIKSLPTALVWNMPGKGEADMAYPSRKCHWAVVDGEYFTLSLLPVTNNEAVILATAEVVEEAINGPVSMDGEVSVFLIPGGVIAAVGID